MDLNILVAAGGGDMMGEMNVWPNVIAPGMYEHPDEGWEDTCVPNLVRIWELAREVGYAVGLHGSLKRDMDLIAAPWTDEAIGNAGLIEHLCAGLPAVRIGGPERKAHGRVAVTLQLDGYFKPIDLSIVPRHADHAAALRRAKAEGMREAVTIAKTFSKGYDIEWWMTLTKQEITVEMCRDVAKAIDARAAQIEEGGW